MDWTSKGNGNYDNALGADILQVVVGTLLLPVQDRMMDNAAVDNMQGSWFVLVLISV